MATRYSKRWSGSPVKTARAGQNFDQNTPPLKKLKIEHAHPEEGYIGTKSDAASFSARSFYGNNEKASFPHSPGQRKTIAKVLQKISDENANIETKHQTKKDLKQIIAQNQNRNKQSQKRRFDVKVVKTPKNKTAHNIDKDLLVNALVKTPSSLKKSLDQNENHSMTPILSRNKFFKTRSPASDGKCFGSMLVRRGFELKFIPRRLQIESLKLEKHKIVKAKPVAKINVSHLKQVHKDGMFYIEYGFKTDGTEIVSGHESDISLKLTDYKDEANTSSQKSGDTNISEEKIVTGVQAGSDNVQLIGSSQKSAASIDNGLASDNGLSQNSDFISDALCGSENLFSSGSVSDGVNSIEQIPGAPSSSLSLEESSQASSVASSPEISIQGVSQKLFPIFMKKTPPQSSQLQNMRSRNSTKTSRSPANGSPLLKYIKNKDNMEQMIIDAGQKKFGATQCDACGMIYMLADPADETLHQKFHHSLLSTLKFSGWKKERVVQEYVDTGCRVVMVTADDPKYAIKKVEEINKIMSQELGFPELSTTFRSTYKAFLFVSEEKMIVGCCLAEPITEGYRVLPDSQPSQTSQSHPGHRPWYCNDTPEKALVGVSKIWVYKQTRRQQIATKLLDCVRQWVEYGTVIPKHLIAFSDPTSDGKIFATKYTGMPNFLVYKYH